MKIMIAVLSAATLAACGAAKSDDWSAVNGGGSSGVHYACGSEQLGISFQLDHRPDPETIPVGSKVLVTHFPFLAGNRPAFFDVVGFDRSESGLTLSLENGSEGAFSVTWKGNSILENIAIRYTWGMHAGETSDTRCILLD